MTLKGKLNDKLVFWGTCLGYGLFLVYLISSFSRFKLLRNRYTNARVATTLYMPRWRLYVASPLGRVVRLYKAEGKQLKEVDVRPFTPTYLYGLDRTPKVIAQEVTTVTEDTTLMGNLKKYTAVLSIGEEIGKYLNTDTVQFADVELPNVLYLHGRYLITMQQPHTWQQNRQPVNIKDTITMVAVNIVHP